MSMRLRYFAAMKAKTLKEEKKNNDSSSLSSAVIANVVVSDPVSEPAVSHSDSVLETEKPPVEEAADPLWEVTHVEEVVSETNLHEDESPKKKGKRFGKESV